VIREGKIAHRESHSFPGPDPNFPQTWNMYSYAWNNPLRYIDPTGLDSCQFSDGSLDNSPETGGLSQGDCEAGGGTWFVPDFTATATATPPQQNQNTDNSDWLNNFYGGPGWGEFNPPQQTSTYPGLPGQRQMGPMIHALSQSVRRTRGCLSQALGQDGNGASLALDLAGLGASLIPGGGIVKGTLQTLALGAQTSVALAGVVNSAAHRQTDVALVGIVGTQIAPLAESGLKYAELVPLLGLGLNAITTVIDVTNTSRAFLSCQAQ
jgi:hypothetical protein